MRKQLGLVVVVLACGCGGGGGDDVEGDVVTIHAGDAALIVGQDGDGAWQQLTSDSSGTAELPVTSGFYGVIVFCADGGAHGTFATDFADITLRCESGATFVDVSGTTAPDAEVWTGQASFATADATGAYSVTVRTGTHDVFAVLAGTPSRLLVRRNIPVLTNSVIDLPIAANGVDMET